MKWQSIAQKSINVCNGKNKIFNLSMLDYYLPNKCNVNLIKVLQGLQKVLQDLHTLLNKTKYPADSRVTLLMEEVCDLMEAGKITARQ